MYLHKLMSVLSIICDSFFTIIFKQIVYDLDDDDDDDDRTMAGAGAGAGVSSSISVIFI
jgi:hypothetical protein